MFSIIATSCYSLLLIYRFKESAHMILGEALEYAENGQIQDAAVSADAFLELWEKTEKTLTRFVRHEALDRITAIASRIPSLGKYEATTQFVAYTNELLAVIEDFWEDELPLPRNLL